MHFLFLGIITSGIVDIAEFYKDSLPIAKTYVEKLLRDEEAYKLTYKNSDFYKNETIAPMILIHGEQNQVKFFTSAY